MKRALLGTLSAVIGIAAAIIIHCNFMIVEIDGSDMLPTFEPGQKVAVFLNVDADDIQEGDIIAYNPPFYEIGSGNGPLIRRVAGVDDSEYILVCDASLTDNSVIKTSDDAILGKVITF
ncbi:MAG: S26 family signal peptidase [Firmicutes bacterium]|jgi:signal peptidase I|nr:S26 family signal peptidase [Bacillota bacterium]